MTETLPNTPNPEAPSQQTAAFWLHALHDLAQPVQALALFAERLRRMDVVFSNPGMSLKDLAVVNCCLVS